jgi:hypothetical protein
MKQFFAAVLLLASVQMSFGQLSGSLSGTLGPGTFHVVDTISVESGDTLCLLPGTTFTFDGGYPFNIRGTLLAMGVSGNFIGFTANLQTNPTGWRGLRFLDSSSTGSQLTLCLIENGRAQGSEPDNFGGGIYCGSSSPIFSSCTISNNGAYLGGGIYCNNSSASFAHCVVSDNSGSSYGVGGVYCLLSSPSFTNCTIRDNSANDVGGVRCDSSSPHFDHCTISENQAYYTSGVSCYSSSPTFTNCSITNNRSEFYGGIFCWDSSPVFMNCSISSNRAQGTYPTSGSGGGVYFCNHSSGTFVDCTISFNSAAYGGGVRCRQNSWPTFIRCAISHNAGYDRGGGLNCGSSSPIFTQCTFNENRSNGLGGAAYCAQSAPSFNNCTFVGNTAPQPGGGVFCTNSSPIFNSTIVSYSNRIGIQFDAGSQGTLLKYCNIYGNTDGAFGGEVPNGLGLLVMTNANGDSCDAFQNIFLNPRFEGSNLHLLATSPCIDAGDPALSHDPDSTIADIGAFYYHQLNVEWPVALLPTMHVLHSNWPNPFNSSTMIRFDVPMTDNVSLTIFNLLGQQVATLFDGRQFAGIHTIQWDASDCPSGIYLCRMEAGGFVQTRKMVLVK